MAGVIILILGLVLGIFVMVKAAGAAPASASGESVQVGKYPYEAEIRASGASNNIDPDLIAAVISWEQRSATSWDPRSTNPNDPSYGLGQVTPWIAVRFGVIGSEADFAQLYIPEKNIEAASRFLKWLLNNEKYALGPAIQMYNEGETNYSDGYRVQGYEDGVMGYYSKFRGY